MVPPIVVALASTYRQGLQRYHDLIIGIGCVIVAACAIAIGALAARYGAMVHFPGLLLVILFTYLFVGLRFTTALLTASAISLGYILLTLVMQTPAQVVAYRYLFLGMTNAVGLLAGYAQERLARQDFLYAETLKFQATRDSLTGLLNRRAMDEKLDIAWRQMQRRRDTLALLIIDIDHFKRYNDLYGHLAGDECLKRVAGVLVNIAKRPLDFVARYGGEEFVLVLAGPRSAYIDRTAEQLRCAIEALKIPHAGSDICDFVTLSIGATLVRPGSPDKSPQIAFSLADQALYDAKQQGRNHYVFKIPLQDSAGPPRDTAAT